MTAAPDDYRVERLTPGASREPYRPLLLLADEPKPLATYFNDGDLYVLHGAGDEPLGVILVLPHHAEPDTAELKAVAVAASEHNRGLGQRMVRGTLDDLRKRGYRRIIVGTSNAGIGQIAFYQKCGFRLLSIERDYFTREKGYDPEQRENGLGNHDMVWFDQFLT